MQLAVDRGTSMTTRGTRTRLTVRGTLAKRLAALPVSGQTKELER